MLLRGTRCLVNTDEVLAFYITPEINPHRYDVVAQLRGAKCIMASFDCMQDAQKYLNSLSDMVSGMIKVLDTRSGVLEYEYD